jgi:F-type H+-transporting ATPase subunit b
VPARVLILLVATLLLGGRLELRAAPQRIATFNVPAFTLNPDALLQTDEGGSTSSREELLKWILKSINFLILAAVLVYLLRKPLARFFAERLDTIHEGLEEGRRALATSEAKLAEVEAKLKGLEQEIVDFRARAQVEMQAERERLRQASERDAQRVMEFANAQIEAAVRAAKLELKRYAAGQALELAEAAVRRRLDEPLRHQLVSRFVAQLKESRSKN